jgi:hypothetical protein
MRDRTEPPAASESLSPADLPPLRIHHLLAWMAVTAVLISGSIAFDRWARNGPPIADPVVVTALVVGAVALAAAITLFGFAIAWRRRGIAFPRQPGDMLLTIVTKGAFSICGVVAGVFVIFFIFGDDDWQPVYYLIAIIIAAID